MIKTARLPHLLPQSWFGIRPRGGMRGQMFKIIPSFNREFILGKREMFFNHVT